MSIQRPKSSYSFCQPLYIAIATLRRTLKMMMSHDHHIFLCICVHTILPLPLMYSLYTCKKAGKIE